MFCTSDIPVTVVCPYIVPSISRPVQFEVLDPELDMRSKWISGMNNNCFVYLEGAELYLPFILPGNGGCWDLQNDHKSLESTFPKHFIPI